MNLSPILGVWDGFSLESGGNTPITGDALTPYVEDVLNELEVGIHTHNPMDPHAEVVCSMYLVTAVPSTGH